MLEFLALLSFFADLKNRGPTSPVTTLLPYICTICSARETVVTFIMSFSFHTSSFRNLVAFIEEKTEAEERVEMTKVLQIVCEEAETGAPLLDTKSSPL